MKKITAVFLLSLLVALFSACGDAELGGFQKNEPDPDFVLFDMFKNYPALDEIWDVMDQDEMNEKMADMIRGNKEDFVIFSRIFRDIMQDHAILPGMMKDTRVMIGLFRTTESRYMDTRAQGSFYDKTPTEYRRVMYALADRLRRDSADKGMTDSILAVARKVTKYMTDTKNAKDLQADMSDLIKDINDLERDDFLLLSKNIGKVMAAASYPMWIRNPEFSPDGDGKFGILETDYAKMTDGTNSGLGNAVKGTHSMMTGLRDRLGGRISDRDLVYNLMSDLRKTLLEPENGPVIKDFITTVEKYFTVGGSVYGNALNTANSNVNSNLYNTSSSNLYSDTEISNTLKETLAAQLGLLLRDDRCGALTSSEDSKGYALERFAQRLADTGIDWKKAKLEESLYDIMVVDPYGRDRRDSTGFDGRKPYAISFLEDFFFLGGVTNNFGWKDGGGTNEVSGSTGFAAVCNDHGHGAPTNFITLNDSLFSITSKRELELMGTYELALENSGRADHIFRSYRPFNNDNKNSFRFYFDQNYGALDFVTGGAVGDLGLPGPVYNGGNVRGGGGLAVNSYRPYNGNGIDEKELAGWTLGWVARACFEGEGPYYYKDPKAATESINGETYYRYMRPNGKVYAYVHYNGAAPDKYLYPVDGNDPQDTYLEGSVIPQRQNRYKSTWNTDYYMISSVKIPAICEAKNYTPNDMSGNATSAGCLTYNELIGEYEPVRGCASQEEAIFRNYQWVMTEKKFVIVIPLWIIKNTFPLYIQSVVFQIMEGHGFAGMASARKFRDNKYWAKAGTDGYSNIPGDYRMDVRVKPISGLVSVNDEKIYDATLGFGPATYSVVFHALAPLYRLGFPRSPLLNQYSEEFAEGYGDTSKMNFEHYQLGSRQFSVGDDNWNKRNMIMPLLAALVNVLHESGTPESKTVSNFLDGTLPLLKPLFIYNKDISGGVCTDSFLPRVNGGATDTSYKFSHSNALIPEQFIKGALKQAAGDATGWFGGWAVRNYYMARPMTTLFSCLIDRTGIDQANPDSNREGRAGGILPILTKYDMSHPRSEKNKSETRIVSNLVDQLAKLSKPEYRDKPGIDYDAPDFDDTQYANWGAGRRIFYGLEQMMSAGKMEKAPYIVKLQERSTGTDVAKGGTATKMQRIPEWIFQKRDVDIDMDEILDRVVGYNDPDGDGPLEGTGLAAYPDNKNWNEFYEDQADMARLFDNLLVKGAKYGITGDLLDAADSFLLKNMSDAEIASFMYTSGKLFAWHTGGRWVWQGDEVSDTPDNPKTDFAVLWRMLKDYLPLIHNKISPEGQETLGGENYMAMLKVLSSTLKEDGLVPFVMDVSLSANTEQLVDDIYEFLGEDFVIGGGAMWMSLADLMDDLASNVGSTTPDTVAEIYSQYGFQLNSY